MNVLILRPNSRAVSYYTTWCYRFLCVLLQGVVFDTQGLNITCPHSDAQNKSAWKGKDCHHTHLACAGTHMNDWLFTN